MKIVIVIPAKGKSKRVKNKNLYEINGKTLIRRACEKVLRCKSINRFYLDTEDEGIIRKCADLSNKGLQIIHRPLELATNFTGANELMIFALHSVGHCNLMLQTFATSPLISAKTIDRCVAQFLNKRKNEDSFFTVTKTQEYFWKNNKPFNFDVEVLPNSFELEPLYMETHGLYGIFTDSLLKTKTRVGLKSMLIEIPKIESLDINGIDDLYIAEKLLTK